MSKDVKIPKAKDVDKDTRIANYVDPFDKANMLKPIESQRINAQFTRRKRARALICPTPDDSGP